MSRLIVRRKISDTAKMPLEDRSENVDVLELGSKTARLKSAGFLTVGDVMDDAARNYARIRDIPSFGKRSIGQVQERVGAIITCTGADGRVDWVAFAKICGVIVNSAFNYSPVMPEGVRSTPVKKLHLGARTGRIVAGGLPTIGCLIDDRNAGYRRLKHARRLGSAAVIFVERRLRLLDSCSSPDGVVDWARFDAICNGQAVDAPGPLISRSGLRSVAEADRNRCVSILGLGQRVERLQAGGLATLGSVLDDAFTDFPKLRSLPLMGDQSVGIVRQRVGAVLSCLMDDGSVDWDSFSLLCGLVPISLSENQRPLSAADRHISIASLQLGAMSGRITKAGLSDVGQINDDWNDAFARLKTIRMLGVVTLEIVEQRLRMMHVCRRADGSVDWKMFNAVCNGQIVPLPDPHSRIVRPASLDQADVSDDIRSQSIDLLGIGTKSKYLKRAGILNIGHLLVNDPREELARIAGIGNRTTEIVCSRISDIRSFTNKPDPVKWKDIASSWGFRVLPDHSIPSGKVFVSVVPEVIKAWVDAHESQSDRLILDERLLRPKGDRLTLDDIGQRLGVTRERVRQREKKLIRGLNDALFSDPQSHLSIMFSSEFRQWWERIKETVKYSEPKGNLFLRNELIRMLGVDRVAVDEIFPLVSLVFTKGSVSVESASPLIGFLLGTLHRDTLKTPVVRFPLGRLTDHFDSLGIYSLEDMLVAAREDRIPRGRSARDCSKWFAATAQSLDENGAIVPDLLAKALRIPLVPEAEITGAEGFLDCFNESVHLSLLAGGTWNRKSHIWTHRTSRPARQRPTIEDMAADLGAWQMSIKNEESLLLAGLNEQLIEQKMVRSRVIWRPEFLTFVKQAAEEWQGSHGSLGRFYEKLAGRWTLPVQHVELKGAGLGMVFYTYQISQAA